MTYRRARLPLAAAVVLMLSACTSGSSGGAGPTGPGTASSGTAPSGSSPQSVPPGQLPAPVYDREVTTYAYRDRLNRMRVKVYPLQRVAGALLLTVDFTPVSDGGTVGNDALSGQGQVLDTSAFRGSSLVDTSGLVRYGVLRQGSAKGAPYSSLVSSTMQKLGVTYRVGGFFPDPGPGVTALTVDLQLAGMVPGVPISADGTVAPGLALGVPGVRPAEDRPDLVTWPVSAPGPDAFVDRHDLVAKVVGGTVNEGGGGQGLVTVNADVLFAFDSAAVSAGGQALVRQAASILAGKADPAQPVAVVGYTDSKGAPAYNRQLSQRRAAAVVAALTASGLVRGLTLQPEGRGEKDPVAANTRAGGADNPQGRALNRRVEIRYTPKPVASPSPTSATVSTTPSAGAAPSSPAATAPDDVEPAVRLPRAGLAVGPGGDMVYYQAAVLPAVRDRALTLVRFDLALEEGDHDFLSALSSHAAYSRDLGDVRIVDPATGRAYVPAYDRDDPARVLCTQSSRMAAGSPFRYACYVAALPDPMSTAALSLGGLGTATGVPIGR